MIFTGSELMQKRNFYTQTGEIGFEFSCIVDNTTGIYHFGITGSNGSVDFKLQSGHISYATQNSIYQFIHAYRSNEQFIIEAELTSGSINILKNDSPLIYGNPKASGAFDYFYINRENSSMGAIWDLNISGSSTPTYSVTNKGYLLVSGQVGVTGYFVNTSRWPIRVFNSEIQASQNYTFAKLVSNMQSHQTGAFAYSGDFDSLDLTQPILTTFNTNFDDTSILFTIVDARTLNRFVYLTAPTDFTFNQDGILNRQTTWLNYSGGVVTDNFDTQLSISLAYAAGTGVFTGIWDLLTGLDPLSLVSLKTPGWSNTGIISGAGVFSANSSINLQVTYDMSDSDIATLVISGIDILNPITSTLSF